MIYKVPGNFVIDTLKDDITDDATTIRLHGSYDLPAVVVISRSSKGTDLLQSETVLLESLNNDVYTVVRDYDLRGSRAHEAGEQVMFNFTAQHYSGLITEITKWKQFLLLAFGRNLSIQSGVIRTSLDDFAVTPTVTPSGSVVVAGGFCVVEGQLIHVEDSVTLTVDASGQIYIDQTGEIDIASTPDPDVLILAQVTASAAIEEGDITDVRTFY